MKNAVTRVSVAALIAMTSGTYALADVVKLSGSTTVVNVVIKPHRATVEKSTGHTLEIVGQATGKGMVDMIDNKADAAMVSEPLDMAVASAEVAGRKIDASKLQMHYLRKDEIVFLVNASNPVSKLSFAQLSDIHTGKITNWKQVGGKDQAITVYSEGVSGATRAIVRKVVMNGADYADSVKALTSISRIAELIPNDDSGIGGLGKGFVKSDGKTKVIETTKIERPLALVTVGEPSAKVKKVVDAFKAATAL